MASGVVAIPYSDDLLLALREEPETFEREARLLLAVKLYELGKLSTGMAAQLAGITRVSFMLELTHYGLSPIGVAADELAEDTAHA